MGYDKPSKKHLLKNSSPLAAAFWGKVMEEALKDVPKKSFPQLDNEIAPEPTETPETAQTVTGLSAAYDPSTMTVNLNWEAVPVAGVEYRIYRRETSEAEFGSLLNTVTTSAGDFSALPGLVYEYYVTSYDPALKVESEPSNVVSVSVQDEMPTPEPTIDPNLPTPTPEDGGNNGENGNGGNNGGGNEGGGNDGGTTIPEITPPPPTPMPIPTPEPTIGGEGSGGESGNVSTNPDPETGFVNGDSSTQ